MAYSIVAFAALHVQESYAKLLYSNVYISSKKIDNTSGQRWENLVAGVINMFDGKVAADIVFLENCKTLLVNSFNKISTFLFFVKLGLNTMANMKNRQQTWL